MKETPSPPWASGPFPPCHSLVLELLAAGTGESGKALFHLAGSPTPPPSETAGLLAPSGPIPRGPQGMQEAETEEPGGQGVPRPLGEPPVAAHPLPPWSPPALGFPGRLPRGLWALCPLFPAPPGALSRGSDAAPPDRPRLGSARRHPGSQRCAGGACGGGGEAIQEIEGHLITSSALPFPSLSFPICKMGGQTS